MTLSIRPARLSDLEPLTALLLADAQARAAADPVLWSLDANARDKAATALETALTAQDPPVRQHWLVAESGGALIGAAHTILLPVPPIYAGRFGPPGLIMEDCYTRPDAHAGTPTALLQAAEADLRTAGAQILLASSLPGGAWEETYARAGYAPLTLYFAKNDPMPPQDHAAIRPATEADVPAIVAASAVHRHILTALHPTFWEPHAEADARFGAWMRRSLTLSDRDMVVCTREGSLTGYGISQPATPLHVPPPHEIAGIGVIDDYYHAALQDPQALGPDGADAIALLTTAEAARAARGDRSVLVVCPAAWASKIATLKAAGYHHAITWSLKIPA